MSKTDSKPRSQRLPPPPKPSLAVYTSTDHDWEIVAPVVAELERSCTVHVIAGGEHRLGGAAPACLGRYAVSDLVDDLAAETSDTARAAAAARTLSGLSAVLARIAPEALMVAGERIETVAAALAAAALRIPIIYRQELAPPNAESDERYRRTITGLASLTIVAHAHDRERLRAWGEPDDRIVVSGTTALDDLYAASLPDSDELAAHCMRSLGPPLLLVRLDSTTGVAPAAVATAVQQGASSVLADHPRALVLIVSSPCHEAGAIINAVWRAWAARDLRVQLVRHMQQTRWWGLMAYAAAVIGNTADILLEAPSFGLPVIYPHSHQPEPQRIDQGWKVPPAAEAVAHALRAVLAEPAVLPRVRRPSPFGDGNAASRSAAAIRALLARPRAERLRTTVS